MCYFVASPSSGLVQEFDQLPVLNAAVLNGVDLREFAEKVGNELKQEEEASVQECT